MRKKYSAQCPSCSNQFESLKQNKKFCSMACYVASPEWRERMLKNMANGRLKGKGPTRTGDEKRCLHCPKTFYVKPCDEKRGRGKFCSKTCYRKFLSERFDRAVATPVSYRELQCYDEFLSRGELYCLVDDCEWTGHSLSLHMNQAHGIRKDEFKKMAGFNLTTGVVSSVMRDNLCARGNQGTIETLNQPLALRSRKFDYISRERLEHYRKMLALKSANNI
jgi:hypothetical protein